MFSNSDSRFGIVGNNLVKKIRVVSLKIQETGTYNQQYMRPYESNITVGTLNSVLERVGNQGPGEIQSEVFRGLASDIIAPTATPEAQIGIAGGWSEKRLRFVLEIEYERGSFGVTNTEYIMGYTDYTGVSMSGHIDPQMTFYINNTIITTKQKVMTPTGINIIEVPSENTQVMCDNAFTGIFNGPTMKMIRPEDLFKSIQNSVLYSSGDEVFDNRLTVTSIPVKSSRVNNLPDQYLTNVVNSYINAQTSLNDLGTQSDLYNKAISNASIDCASRDPFMGAISVLKERNISNVFTMQDLLNIDPNADNVTTIAAISPNAISMLHQTGQTAAWGGSDRVTLMASVIAQTVPAIMMELMISSICFTSTNYDGMGRITTVISDGKGFTNLDMTSNFNKFIYRFENEVANILSFNNQDTFAVEIISASMGETWIKLSLSGGGFYDFVVPTFCDNLIAPVVTTDKNRITQIANDIDSLVTNLADNVTNKSTATNPLPVIGGFENKDILSGI